MEISLFESSAYVHPGDRVEFPVIVDRGIIRVAIAWPLLEHLTGTSPIDEGRARAFLYRRREDIARALKAHLYAQGNPASGYLDLARDDFDPVGRAAHWAHAGP